MCAIIEARKKLGCNVSNFIKPLLAFFLCAFDRCNKVPICLLGQIPAGARRVSHYIRPLWLESYFDSIAKPPGDTIIIDPNDEARGEL